MSTKAALSQLVEAIRDHGVEQVIEGMSPLTKDGRDKLCRVLPPITDNRRLLERRTMVSAPVPQSPPQSPPSPNAWVGDLSESVFKRTREVTGAGYVVTTVSCNGVVIASSSVKRPRC